MAKKEKVKIAVNADTVRNGIYAATDIGRKDVKHVTGTILEDMGDTIAKVKLDRDGDDLANTYNLRKEWLI